MCSDKFMCDPLLWCRRHMFKSRARPLRSNILKIQPVHTACGKCVRSSHCTVWGVHVSTGQSGKYSLQIFFLHSFWDNCLSLSKGSCSGMYQSMSCHDLREKARGNIKKYLPVNLWTLDKVLRGGGLWHHVRHLGYSLPVHSYPEEGSRWKEGQRGCLSGQDKIGYVSCLSTFQFRQPLSLNRCHFRWAPLDLMAGFTRACCV